MELGLATVLSCITFDAIVANNDEMALGAINVLKATKRWTRRLSHGASDFLY
jgi:ABC-type sugar transport system substrate-binding protein